MFSGYITRSASGPSMALMPRRGGAQVAAMADGNASVKGTIRRRQSWARTNVVFLAGLRGSPIEPPSVKSTMHAFLVIVALATRAVATPVDRAVAMVQAQASNAFGPASCSGSSRLAAVSAMWPSPAKRGACVAAPGRKDCGAAPISVARAPVPLVQAPVPSPCDSAKGRIRVSLVGQHAAGTHLARIIARRDT